MGLMQWNAKLETRHPKIDEQHKALIEAFNRLHDAMKQGKGRDEVGKVLEFLKDYTVQHFAMEEKLMADAKYPGFAHHKQLHADLVSKVGDLVQKFKAGSATLTLPTMDFLQGWLTEHIQGEDVRLAEFLRK